MAKYVIDETTLKAIADEMRRYAPNYIGSNVKLTPEDMALFMCDVQANGYDVGYTEGEETGYANGYAEGEATGIENGKQQANDAFWDAYQHNGTRTQYTYAFSGEGWNDVSFNPKYDIVATNQCDAMFYNAQKITSTKKPIIIDTTSVAYNIFAYCMALKSIPSIKVTEQVPSFSYWFTYCSALEELIFTEDSRIASDISFGDCYRLNTASVNSIIAALKDFTGATAKTLTLHATVGGKLTEEQKAAITAKNWTLVY
jgi:hypothetical protein